MEGKEIGVRSDVFLTFYFLLSTFYFLIFRRIPHFTDPLLLLLIYP
ncbi:MAG: hypothetical protein AB1422_16915 [bacterium]